AFSFFILFCPAGRPVRAALRGLFSRLPRPGGPFYNKSGKGFPFPKKFFESNAINVLFRALLERQETTDMMLVLGTMAQEARAANPNGELEALIGGIAAGSREDLAELYRRTRAAV